MGLVSNDLMSLLAIAIVAAAVPLFVGMLRLRIADVVLLIGCGILLGPQVFGFISVTDPIALLAELGLAMLFFLAGPGSRVQRMRRPSSGLEPSQYSCSHWLRPPLAATSEIRFERRIPSEGLCQLRPMR
jgi:hypothetical protein